VVPVVAALRWHDARRRRHRREPGGLCHEHPCWFLTG
jgi:hypothetical protein